MDRTDEDAGEPRRERGASDPEGGVRHPNWVRIAAVVVLAAFVLATLVAALLS